MADNCSITAKAGGSSKGYEQAVSSNIKGSLQEVESDLPEDIRDHALHVFQAAVMDHSNVGDAIKRVQTEALSKIDERFKGERYKGFIKFDYDTSVVEIKVNKFGNGNSQFSSGIGVKKMVCPDPFMGRLSDPNMNKR
ncbi:hypothetical protein TCAL_11110 [Tigriopus californicus]|uniref:Uncharacterized protein n=1 Tax=Tigriopus californicus TaxID=6832 RepID=A0A553PBB1_TIGCA|nr:uncharacterized protein LOC131893197 [Tigriopus californicus]TRY74975.1 hypothetical protein TCAL_11110 [Tigriopus californicus]|eukprot:TCALIF_11110-PA protein Name:"Protein of unknown function" AED:0.00 eAED:0.00 QI:228/1/1/1/1/1/3/534/137